MMLIKLGQARARQGDTDAARADLERGVHIAERIGEKDDAASGYLELAELARQLGDPDRARELVAPGGGVRRSEPPAAGHDVHRRSPATASWAAWMSSRAT